MPGEPAGTTASISFACVLGQLDEIAQNCEALTPGCTSGPEEKPWNSIELTITTPERAQVVMTAAQPLDPHSPAADRLREIGIAVHD